MTDRALRLLALLAVLSAAPAADAQVLYKLIGRDGKVSYTDTAPKNFDGTVIRLEPDVESNVLPSRKAPAKAAEPAKPGMAQARRAAREALGARLRAAQEKVEAARKAKAEGESPQNEEMQTIQRLYPPLKPGQAPPRPNCFASVDPNGNPGLICPMQVPQEAFFDRVKKLDEELRRAEEELELAEREYRRGTD